MFLTKATAAAGKLVELKTDVVELLEAVRTRLNQTGQAEASIEQAVLAIYRDRQGLATDTIVGLAVAQLQLPSEDINARLDQLQSYLIDIDERAEPFVLPLSHAARYLQLPLKFAPANRPLEVGDVAFALGGEADTALTLHSFPGASAPHQWRGKIAAGDAIQGLSMAGKMGFRGSASGAFGNGTVHFAASMTGGGRINFYHQYRGTASRAAALVSSSHSWAAPWDLAALQATLTPVDRAGHAVGFRRIEVHGSGTLALAGGVTVGKVMRHSAGAASPLDATTFNATGRFAAALDFALKRAGAFTYIIEKDPDGFITVNLTRGTDTRTSRSLSLNADVTVTGLADVARQQVHEFFDDPADLLTLLHEWTRPGDKLVERLLPADWNEPVVRKIGQLLLGEGKPEELTSSATQALEGKLRTFLNESIPFWGENSGDVADQLLGAVTERLDLSPELATELGLAVRTTLTTRIDSVHAQFETAIVRLIGDAQAPLEQLLQPFASVGEDVADLQQRVHAQASSIIEPAITLLKRYQDIRNKLLGGLEKVAKFKIGMAYAASVSHERGTNSLLSFRVRDVNPTTRAIHRAFLLGRIDSVWPEFQRAVDEASPWIDNVEGRFAAFAKRTGTVGFALNFGDHGIAMTRVKASDVDVQVSPDGTVLVAAEKISQEKIVKAFQVERSVGFSAAYDLVLAAREPDAFPTPLGFNLVYDDDRLRTKELRQFLDSLEHNAGGRPLLASGAAANAVARFEELRHATHGGGARARVDVTLPVSIRDLATLIHIPDDTIRNRAADLLIELIVVQPRQRDLLRHLASAFDGGVSERDVVFFTADLSHRQAAARLGHKTGIDLDSDHVAGGKALLRRLRKIGRDAGELVKAVDGIRDIARLQQQIAALPAELPSARARDIVQQLEAINTRINDGLDSWLEPRGGISGFFTEAVPAMTVTLLGLIADLSGDDTKLVPIISVAGIDGGQIAVV